MPASAPRFLARTALRILLSFSLLVVLVLLNLLRLAAGLSFQTSLISQAYSAGSAGAGRPPLPTTAQLDRVSGTHAFVAPMVPQVFRPLVTTDLPENRLWMLFPKQSASPQAPARLPDSSLLRQPGAGQGAEETPDLGAINFIATSYSHPTPPSSLPLLQPNESSPAALAAARSFARKLPATLRAASYSSDPLLPRRPGALAESAAPNMISHITLPYKHWKVYDPVQYGIFDENGMALSQRVNLPLDQQNLISGAPPLPNPEAIFPNMHWNKWLRDRGVAIMLDNTNEFAGAITSPRKGLGLKQGASNAGQYSLENDIDWERLAGLKGFETHIIGVGRYGIPASRMFGDNINPSSEIYGGGGNVFFHLVFFYGEETLFNGRLNIAAGRMSMLWDYSNSPIYCNFMNNAFCGNPKTSTDSYTRSSYPGTDWGIRVRGRPTNNIYIQVGAYFPDRGIYTTHENRTGFKFNGAEISGVQIPVEVGWEPQFGADRLQGHYKVGAAPDTSRHFLGVYNPPDARNNAKANMYTPDGFLVPGTGRLRHFGWGIWALADQMILRHHTRDTMEGGLIAFAGAYWNNPSTSMRGKLYEVGLVDTGFWPSRPLDTVGVAFSYTGSDRYTRRAQAFQMAHGMSPPNGTPFWNNVGDTASGPLMWGSYGIQRWGSTLEAMYRIHVTRGVTFAPDFQYYFHPGMQRRLKDAAMLGFKSHIQLF
ncbi:carbohydrate porin [Oecophyllibacter saccharovorans]|uniref:carbohydrate porin n=1 Tax=Oecophyllibacter saccharovorans TaxID=2558360 RepID=UPI001F4F136E|nr:carbohydrate porin [Oecophyllibacter saccharovorans]